MEAKQILEIVQDFTQWKGDSYRLAYLIADAQKEAAAKIAEEHDELEIADMIRGS